ncbi:hypothetical protein GCM10009535_12440 [Streptomyces thermocarboxydovorans]|jgi:hypothetical protein|uniref:Uncharacterized protein n=1 Tax=Streptomyces thermocarboxydovorans TaxID=59298 RepID=A0ABN1HC11_9ACTN
MKELLTFADARTLKEQGDLGRFIKHHMAEAQRAAAYRRSLVLRYPDLAAKLTQPPIGHTSPQMWNGYIPPATDCRGAINTAPCRPALLELVAEAERRQQQPQQTSALEEAA